MTPCPAPDNSKGCAKDWPVIPLQQNVAATVTLQLVDDDGDPVDVTGLEAGQTDPNDAAVNPVVIVVNAGLLENIATAKVWMKQYASDTQVVEVTGNYTGGGEFEFDFTPNNLGMPGLFVATILLNGTDGGAVFAKNCYVEVEHNTTDGFNYNAPLSIAEVRLALRDCPGSNFLLEDYEFTEREIMFCIRRPIDYFNDLPPDVARFSYTNFPFRYWWLQGTVAELLKLAAHWMRRNRLKYQAGGISIDDLGREDEYEAVAKQMWDEFKTWCQNKKVEINISQGFGSLGGRWSM
jgi:hypothetical protein